MDNAVVVALISAGWSALVAITALILNYRGFASIDARFGSIDTRFGAMDGRFAALERRLTSFDEKVKGAVQPSAVGYARSE